MQQTLGWVIYPRLTDEGVGEVTWKFKKHQIIQYWTKSKLVSLSDYEWEVFYLVHAVPLTLQCSCAGAWGRASRCDVRVLGSIGVQATPRLVSEPVDKPYPTGLGSPATEQGDKSCTVLMAPDAKA